MVRESIFRSRDFRLFYFGQATSYIGDGLRAIALPLLVFKLTGSALNLGLTYSLEVFTFGVFSLVGGSLADRLDRKRLMMTCDVVRSCIILSFAIGYREAWLSIPILYLGIVLHSACGAIFNGSQASSIPYILGKDRATSAIGALIGTESAVNTVAPPIGAALFGLIGPFMSLTINAGTYLASIASLWAMRDLGPEEAHGLPHFGHVISDIRLGFRFLLGDRAMKLMSLASFGSNFFGILGYAAYVPFIKRDLGGSDLSVGIFFGASGAGVVLGALLAPKLRTTFGRIAVFAYFFGLVQVGVLLVHDASLAAIFIGAASIAGGLSVTATLGWRMRIIPEDMVGRVFGAARILVLGGTLPGAIVGGLLSDARGPWLAIFVATMGQVVMALLVVSSPTIRRESR